VIRAYARDTIRPRWARSEMLRFRRDEQSISEGEATTLGDRLNGHVGILAPTKGVWKMNKTCVMKMTGSEVARGLQLLGDRRMRNDDARDRRSMVGANKQKRRRTQDATSVGRNAEVTNAKGAVGVISSIKEANRGVDKRAISKKEFGIVGCASHGTIVGVRVDSGRIGVVGSRQTTNVHGIR
jgi:hypothetical protein